MIHISGIEMEVGLPKVTLFLGTTKRSCKAVRENFLKNTTQLQNNLSARPTQRRCAFKVLSLLLSLVCAQLESWNIPTQTQTPPLSPVIFAFFCYVRILWTPEKKKRAVGKGKRTAHRERETESWIYRPLDLIRSKLDRPLFLYKNPSILHKREIPLRNLLLGIWGCHASN